jgi:hypothetical protein
MTTRAITQHIVEDSYTRKQIFRVLIALLVILSASYIYFIGSITFNIIARRTLEATMRENSSRVSGMEVEYLTLSNKIDIPSGLARGFVETQALFASRSGAAARVALR